MAEPRRMNWEDINVQILANLDDNSERTWNIPDTSLDNLSYIINRVVTPHPLIAPVTSLVITIVAKEATRHG